MKLPLWIGLMILVFGCGCSVFMAAKQPDEKNISLFMQGVPRSLILAEFGLPVVSEIRDGRKHDIFKFVQGYSSGAKAGRAIFHGAADVLTLGLWEIVGTPTESAFDGDRMAYDITYDENDKIIQVIPLNTTSPAGFEPQPVQQQVIQKAEPQQPQIKNVVVKTPDQNSPPVDTGREKNCYVKGVVRFGEKYYYTPGDRKYYDTQLDPGRGDKWFCSEEEAAGAGFRSIIK